MTLAGAGRRGRDTGAGRRLRRAGRGTRRHMTLAQDRRRGGDGGSRRGRAARRAACAWRLRKSRGQLRRAHADRRLPRGLLDDLLRDLPCRRSDRRGIRKDARRYDCRRAAVCEILARDLRRRIGGAAAAGRAGHLIDRRDVDIGDVDVADIARVARVAWPIDFARRQRKPADRRPDTGRVPVAHTGLADKGDKRRRIDRHRHKLAGDPGPLVFDHRPAPVMERRKAPGLVIDPAPAPGLDPDPMPFAIRSPARRDAAREPDLAILRDGAPGAVLVELLIAGHLRRHVIRGREAALVIIARAAPFCERVARRALGRRGQRLRPADDCRVAGIDRDIERAADKAGAAFEHGDALRLVRPAGVDVVNAGLQDPHRTARQIDLDALAFEKRADPQIDAALRHGQLHDLLIELCDIEHGIACEGDRAAADAQFGARFRIGPERAAGRHGIIDLGRRPGGFARQVKTELARDKADPSDPGGRRFLGKGRQDADQDDREKAESEAAHRKPRKRVPGDNGSIAAPL